MSLRIVIVDDEPACVRRLELALAGLPGVELVGVAGDGVSGLALVRERSPDLVFLDVRMPDMDGLELAQALSRPGEPGPAIVFATAFADFALPAFDLDAADYLLKPVEAERVRAAVERVRERRRVAAPRALDELSRAFEVPRGETADDALHWLWVADVRGRTRVPIAEVERFEAERDYVRIHTAERAWLIRSTLQGLESRLDPDRFVRAHRSQIINIDAVRGLRRRVSGAMVAALKSGVEAPVGRAFLADLKQRLGLSPAQ